MNLVSMLEGLNVEQSKNCFSFFGELGLLEGEAFREENHQNLSFRQEKPITLPHMKNNKKVNILYDILQILCCMSLYRIGESSCLRKK